MKLKYIILICIFLCSCFDDFTVEERYEIRCYDEIGLCSDGGMVYKDCYESRCAITCHDEYFVYYQYMDATYTNSIDMILDNCIE